MDLLRKHSDVYPTGMADIHFAFPVESEEEEELRLNFNWEPALMSELSSQYPSDDDLDTNRARLIEEPEGGLEKPEVELLMYAIPHHQERIRPTLDSSNTVQSVGCMPTIHGTACPVSHILYYIHIYTYIYF